MKYPGVNNFMHYWLLCLSLLLGGNNAVNAQNPAFFQDYFTRFNTLTIQDGLSHNVVLDIIQDRHGIMWFATENGLTRYDGIHFTVYHHSATNPRSLCSDVVTALAEDIEGNLWVGTKGGLNRYDRTGNTFIRYTVDKQNYDSGNGLRNSHVKALHADSLGYLWVETADGFLSEYDLNTKVWKHSKHASGVQEGRYYYWHIFEDSNHDLWIGGRAMCPFRFSRKKLTLEELPIWSKEGKRPLEGSCFVETEDKKLISPNAGFFTVYNKEKNEFEYRGGLPLESTSALKDNEGNIWIGGNGGVVCLQSDLAKGVIFKHSPKNTLSLVDDDVKCLYQSPDGIVWIGTEKGISFYSKNLNEFRYYRQFSEPPFSLSSNLIRALMQDRDGTLWIGTGDHGTDTLSLSSEKVGNLTYSLLTKNLDEKTFRREHKAMEQYVHHGLIAGRTAFQPGTYLYQTFRNDTIKYKLNENNVNALYQDKDGIIYIGLWSHVGFNTFSKKTGVFKRHALWSKKPDWLYPMLFEGNPFGSNWYNAFLEDSNSRFWCATWEGFGLNLFNRTTGEFEGKHYMPINAPCRPRNEVTTLALDTCTRKMYMSGGRVYYGYYDFDSCTFKRYAEILPSDYLNRDIINRYYQYYDAKRIPIPMYFAIYRMLWDGDGHIYLADKQEILKHTLATNRVESVYKADEEGDFTWCVSKDKQTVYVGHTDKLLLVSVRDNKVKSFSSESRAVLDVLKGQNIKALYEDGQRGLWIGTNDGLWVYHQGINSMEKISLYPSRKGALNISVIVGAADESVYVGCSYGLVHLKDRKIVREYRFDDVVARLPGNAIRDIYPESSDRLWVATNDGLALYEDKENRPVIFRYDEENPYSLLDNMVYSISPGLDGGLWLATGKGVCVYHSSTKRFEDKSQPGNNCLTSRLASCIMEDRHGNIWLGTTEKGLNVLYTSSDTIGHYTYHVWDKQGLPDNCINCLFEDSRYQVWVGTDKGLCRYNQSTDNFVLIESLQDRQIKSILEDQCGHLWISTDKGLYCILNDGRVKRKFYDFHGLQANSFNLRSSCRLADGRLAFGGDNGFNLFRPENLLHEVTARPIIFSDFKVSDEVRYTDINDLEQICLAYYDNSFSVNFTAADYEFGNHLSYRYRLLPFDKDWVYTTSPFLVAKYTNLSHGTYHFEAEASNPYGEWTGTAREIEISIATPWYLQWWFICLLVILLLGTVVVVIRYREKKLKKRNEELKKAVDERTEELQRTIVAKEQFLSIISHDLKGPCLAMEQMIDILAETDSVVEGKDQSIFILRNASKRVNKLLNNVLDWACSQKKIIKPHFQQVYLRKEVEVTIDVLQSLADKKEIKLTNKVRTGMSVYTDTNLLATILRNLINNAIKYSFRNSEVVIQAEDNGDHVVVSVIDNGIGMSEKDKERLFRIDSKLATSGTERERGTGLGLIVVHEFISLLGEEICIESERHKGTTFAFTLHKKPQ